MKPKSVEKTSICHFATLFCLSGNETLFFWSRLFAITIDLQFPGLCINLGCIKEIMTWQWINVICQWKISGRKATKVNGSVPFFFLLLVCPCIVIRKKLERIETLSWTLVIAPLSVLPIHPVPSAVCHASQGTIHPYRVLPRL